MTTYYRTSATVEPFWATSSGGTPTVNTSAFTSADDAVFDTNSASPAAVPLTLRSLDAAAYTGSLTVSSSLNIYGSVDLGAAGTFTHSGALTYFRSSFGYWTIKTYGKNLKSVIFNVAGGTYTLQDDLLLTGSLSMTAAATLNTNGKYVRATSVTATTGVIAAGVSTIEATTGSLSIGTATSDLSAAALHLSNGSGSQALSVYSGASVAVVQAICVTLTISQSVQIGTFKPLKWGGTVQIAAGKTLTVGSIEQNTSAASHQTFKSQTAGSVAYLAKSGGGTINMNYVDVQDISASPSSTWSVTDGLDLGNNSGISFISSASPASGLFFGSHF